LNGSFLFKNQQWEGCKLKKIIALMTFLMALLPSLCFALGTVVQSHTTVTPYMRTVLFTCTGDSVNGSIPDTVTDSTHTAFIQGWQITLIEAWPKAGGTAPDAADVFILDGTTLEDYLGSADCGTTAKAAYGADLIHATLPKSCLPYMYHTGVNYYWPIRGTLTLRVASQATASAEYYIRLTFQR